MNTKTYVIVYNGQTDFIIAETNHPETLIVELIRDLDYAPDDIQLYKATEIFFNTTKSTIVVTLEK